MCRVSISLRKNCRLHLGDSCQVRKKTPVAALTSSSVSHSAAAVTPCIHHTEGNKTGRQSGWGSAARWRLLVFFFSCSHNGALSNSMRVSTAGSCEVEERTLFLYTVSGWILVPAVFNCSFNTVTRGTSLEERRRGGCVQTN